MPAPADPEVPAVTEWLATEFVLDEPEQRPSLGFAAKSGRRPMVIALLLSLLIHTLLFSLVLSGDGLGLPGLSLPWRDRRMELPELRVTVVQARNTSVEPLVVPRTAPLKKPSMIEPRLSNGIAIPLAAEPALVQQEVAPVVPEAKLKALASPVQNESANIDAIAADALAPPRTDVAVDALPLSVPVPTIAAMERSDLPALVVPPVPSLPARVIAAAPSASSPQAAPPAPPPVQVAKLDAEEEKPKPIDTETAARAAELSKQEAARLEAERQEQARQVALRQEAVRQDAARLEIARQAAVQQEAARQEAARVEGARNEAARLAAERQEGARAQAARTIQDETDRREAARRAMGRQLDEEAAQREAASKATPAPDGRPSSWSSARRGRLFGRADANAELVLYAEAWARKIQLNMAIDKIRELAKRPHTHPMVTVAIRRDGSVESLTFVISSGVAEIDEAIRQIVQSLVPYPSFQPALASEFDVIEIRRTWYFDTAIRLY